MGVGGMGGRELVSGREMGMEGRGWGERKVDFHMDSLE